MAKELPTGLGQQLNQSAETLPAVWMDNEVVWICPAVNSPFVFELGKSCDLGLLLPLRGFAGKYNHRLEVSIAHGRSGILGRLIISDWQGNLYRDIDVKGIGMNGYPSSQKSNPGGLCDFNQAILEAETVDQLAKEGLINYRVIAIIKLTHLLDSGSQSESAETANNRNWISQDFVPAVLVRAFKTKTGYRKSNRIFVTETLLTAEFHQNFLTPFG